MCFVQFLIMRVMLKFKNEKKLNASQTKNIQKICSIIYLIIQQLLQNVTPFIKDN